jgi:hypothetical protein
MSLISHEATTGVAFLNVIEKRVPAGAVVQIAGMSETRRVRHCTIMLKELPSRQRTRWYL